MATTDTVTDKVEFSDFTAPYVYFYYWLYYYVRPIHQCCAECPDLLSGVTRVGDTRGGNWGCHPSIFSWKTWRPFFAHRCHYHYRFLLLSLGCHPLQGVTPHLFTCPTSFLHYSLYICPQFFFLRVSPPGGCHPGRSAPAPQWRHCLKVFRAMYQWLFRSLLTP